MDAPLTLLLFDTGEYPYGETWSAFLSSICWKNYTARFHIGTNAIALKQTMGIFPLCFGFPFFCISFSPNMCELWDFESPRHVHLVKVETCGAHICFFPPGPIVKATHNWTLPSRHGETVVLQGWHSLVFFVMCSSISMFNSASSCDKNRHLSCWIGF